MILCCTLKFYPEKLSTKKGVTYARIIMVVDYIIQELGLPCQKYPHVIVFIIYIYIYIYIFLFLIHLISINVRLSCSEMACGASRPAIMDWSPGHIISPTASGALCRWRLKQRRGKVGIISHV